MTAPLALVHKATCFVGAGGIVKRFEDEPCRLVPAFKSGRGATETTNYLTWTHYVDFDVNVRTIKIVDQCQRASGFSEIIYTSGDDLKVTLERGDAIVELNVSWVEWRYIGEDREYIRVYCTRDSQFWTHL